MCSDAATLRARERPVVVANEPSRFEINDDAQVWAVPDDDSCRTRAAQYKAVLGQLSTGVAILEPTGAPGELALTMVNEVAACYFGRIGDDLDVLAETYSILAANGVIDIALMVSVTGQTHAQEAVPAAGWLAAGRIVDLLLLPLDEGAVALTFVDVTDRRRAGL